MTEKLNLLATDVHDEHIARHLDSNSQNPGSKALPGIAGEMENILKTCDENYSRLIEEKGNPGRVVFGIEAPQNMGSDAVIPLSGLNNNVSVFSFSRDIGTPYEQNIKAVLIKSEDMPKTNVVHAIYGPYGPTGNAGIYTVLYGDEGMPFPRNLNEQSSEADKKFNHECQKYWDEHIFLITPQELENGIKQMQENGRGTALLETRLKVFNNSVKNGTYQNPCNGTYHSEISKSAVKINGTTKNQGLSINKNTELSGL